jgi:hypothetical protein
MRDRDLLMVRVGKRFRGFAISPHLGSQLLSLFPVRIFGKSYVSGDAFCEWFEVFSKADNQWAGVCFTCFYNSAADPVLGGLRADNTRCGDEGFVVLFRDIDDWEVQPGPFLPAHFLRSADGEYCYLVPSAFGPFEQPPIGIGHVASLEELIRPIGTVESDEL